VKTVVALHPHLVKFSYPRRLSEALNKICVYYHLGIYRNCGLKLK